VFTYHYYFKNNDLVLKINYVIYRYHKIFKVTLFKVWELLLSFLLRNYKVRF